MQTLDQPLSRPAFGGGTVISFRLRCVFAQISSRLVERKWAYGRFYGCSNYPKCKFTHRC
ncbi:MAG: topoisomerase DNA-binding C4 zinc finger domain-containing protein [Alistipes sp.]|nr:topoisomerase DNA-binding C4 zinc finger domain-containing protein [Alistipes sp.]